MAVSPTIRGKIKKSSFLARASGYKVSSSLYLVTLWLREGSFNFVRYAGPGGVPEVSLLKRWGKAKAPERSVVILDGRDAYLFFTKILPVKM